jgi:hypothetical protein
VVCGWQQRNRWCCSNLREIIVRKLEALRAGCE